MSVNILCFDGGGIRGLFTSIMLKSLIRDLKNYHQYDLLGNIDLFSGTSTGSFIAVALAQNPSSSTVDTIFNLYRNKGAEIFHVQPFTCECILPKKVCDWIPPVEQSDSPAQVGGIIGDLEEVWDIIKEIAQAKYPIEYTNEEKRLRGLKPALENVLGTTARLCDLPSDGPQVMVNSLQLYSPDQHQWSPVQIGSKDDAFNTMRLVDAGLCSGAAPIYFPPHCPQQTQTDRWGFFADGGLYANNPSAAAFAYARKYMAQQQEDIRVISLGTGSNLLGIPPSLIPSPSCWGAYDWLNPSSETTDTTVDGQTVTTPSGLLLEAALAASAQACGQYAALLAGEGGYVRIDVELAKAVALDDYKTAVSMIPQIEAKTDYATNPVWKHYVYDTFKALTA
jgi:predicted acylesterase/phospholipase RssA